MKSIGGYFELELRHIGNVPHSDGIFLNSGKNALEYLLLSLKPKKVFIPYFTCDVVLEPFKKLKIEYEFYHINDKLELAQRLVLKEFEFLLVNNYFGIKDDYIKYLAEIYKNHLIVDNAQALYAMATQHCIYSPRKFVGIPDGGIVITDKPLLCDLGIDSSYNRCSHLLKRYDLGASAGYVDFKDNSQILLSQPIRRISPLSMALLNSIDFEDIKKKRLENFYKLHDALKTSNQLSISLSSMSVPMVYPYLCRDENLREKLISEKVFVATYWPNVLTWCNEEDIEYGFTKYLLPIPCDQRYKQDDLKKIIEIINS